MLKSNLPFIPDFYHTYINKVNDELKLNAALQKYDGDYLLAEKGKFLAIGNQVYSPGKWTVKDILQHIIDTERVFAYRVLHFARNDRTELPGMDQNLFAENTGADERNVEDLLEEYGVVRQSTILLFRSFNDEMLLREGVCFGKKMTVLALGFTIIGHVLHHLQVLKERYYPLIREA